MDKNYLMREACFACTTPYQILGAISITQGYKLDADIYVFGMFPNYDKVARKLTENNIFTNVYAVDCSEIGAPGRRKGFVQMLFAEKTMAFFLPKNVAYSYFYSSSRAIMKTIMQHVLLKRNPRMKKVIYEDGMGTYAADSHPLNATRYKRVAEKLLGWNLERTNLTSIIANIPGLVDLPEHLKGCTVGQMPRLEINQNTVSVLEDIFSIKEGDKIKQSYIVFDTVRNVSNDFTIAHLALLDECYDIISKIVGKDNMICKPHPKSVCLSHANIPIYPYQEIPMEVLYASMPGLENRILITLTSTAVFTPKILFNKEPRVICLHKIIKNTKRTNVFDNIFEKFKSCYADKARVIAPRTVDELREQVQILALNDYN